MRVSKKSKRGFRRGGRRMDLSPFREVLADGRVWSAIGTVVKPEGEDSHFSIEEDDETGRKDVFVEVSVMPEEQPVTARLSLAGASAGGFGLVRIPKPGTEVVLVFEQGEMDDGDAMIVACLASGSVPDGLDETAVLLIGEDKLVLRSPKLHAESNEIRLGSANAAEKLVLGSTYRQAEDTMLESVKSALTALASALTAAGTALNSAGTDATFAAAFATAAGSLATAASALSGAASAQTSGASAIGTFKGSASDYLSDKSTTEK